MMKNKNLFFTCPASYLEPLLKRIYGQDSYFVTTLGSQLTFEDCHQAEALFEHMIDQRITNVFFVADVNCPFIHHMLQEGKMRNKADKLMEQIYVDNYYSIKSLPGVQEQAELMAEHVVQNQFRYFIENEYIKLFLNMRRLSINGVIIDRKSGLVLKQMHFVKTPLEQAYELGKVS